jgi:hypothetical protein
MKLTTRLLIYSAIITFYLLAIFVGGKKDIWPWGAVILGVPIIIAEVFTQISIRKRR